METSERVPIEIVVEEEIHDEIKRLRQAQDRADTQAFDLQAKLDALEKNNADPAEIDRTHAALMHAINAGTANAEKIKEMRSPAEIERRVQQRLDNAQSIRRLRMATTEAPTKQTARDRGVPEIYLNQETGNFQIGKDARYKSDLILSAIGEVTKEEPGESLMVFETRDAEKRLAERGWTGFLDRKRELLVEKTKQAEKRAAEKEEAARVKAAEKEAEAKKKTEAKEAAAAAKKAENAAAKAAGSSEVQPDPKK